MYPILWEVFLDPSDSYFLFADLVGFYTHSVDVLKAVPPVEDEVN
jgi:hypothetical protein